MFIKAFKQKSNIQLKGSDKKRLKTQILLKYGSTLTDPELSTVITNKSTICAVKIVTHTEQNVTVYTVDKKPMFFETAEGHILPTVYALWALPNMLPMFTTHADVLPKLANGADLMLPGVIQTGEGNLKSWGNHKKDDIFGINLLTNKSGIAVGFLAHSSHDLYMSGGRGIAVRVVHVFGDKLWGMEPSVCQQPPISAPVQSAPTTASLQDFPPLGAEPESKQADSSPIEVTEIMEKLDLQEPELERSPDEVLKIAFLNSLKLHGKKLSLPLLTSTFYPQYVQPALESPLDIKKTSYKKVGNFLKQMASEGFIVIREENKGVEKICSINLEHPELLGFRPTKEKVTESTSDEPKPQLLLTKMTEVFVVTQKTVKLFSNFNHELGEKLDEKQIKDHVKDYVSRNKLLDKTIHKVELDETLEQASDREGTLTIDGLISAVRANMDATFEMRTQDKIPIKGGKKPVIHITTATRTGNKKVTIISNLDLYGINIPEFAKAIKIGVAASTCMTEVPGYKSEQLLVQGNQVKFVFDLLTQTYKIPRGNITGLEFAIKEKKKKK